MAVVDRLDRTPRRQADKFAERRLELARATLQTLSQLGYARTSLREIAQNSEFSHGVLHYYFTDKLDLIICSVCDYKARCVTRYDDMTAGAATYDELIERFLAGLGETLRTDAPMHRLWYDLRAQALFETAFHADIMEIEKNLEAMIWRIVKRAADFTGAPPKLPPPVVYATFDGLFQRGLLGHLAGEENAVTDMEANIRIFLPSCLATPRQEHRANQASAR